MPDVGTRIRVVRTHQSGLVEIVEGRVTATPHDGQSIVVLNSELLVALAERPGSACTVEVLEEAPSADPRFVVDRGGDIWRRLPEGYQVMLTRTIRADSTVAKRTANPVTLAELTASRGPVVPLVRAPHLAELVTLARHGLDATHVDCRRPGPPSGGCTFPDCRDAQAIIARYGMTT